MQVLCELPSSHSLYGSSTAPWSLTPFPHPSAILDPASWPTPSSAPVSEATVSCLQSCVKLEGEANLLPKPSPLYIDMLSPAL